MSAIGITDKAAAQALLTGSPEQAAAVLQQLRACGAEHLFDGTDADANPSLARGRSGIALLKRHLAAEPADADALSLLLKAAQHMGAAADIEWACRRLLRLDPAHVTALCELAKAAHHRGSPAERDSHFDTLVEALRRIVAARKVDLALNCEALIYNNVVKLVEEESYVHSRMSRLIPLMDELGRYVHDLLPDLPATAPSGQAAPRVGFVFPTGALLAHSKVLLSICQAMKAAGLQTILPAIYVVGPAQAEFAAAFKECGVPVKVIAEPREPSNSLTINRLVALRQALATDGIRLATWVSAPPGAAFYAAGRFAPQQAYWSMKFHGMIAPGIDHYVSCASCWETEKTVHGQEWLCGPVSFNDALAGGNPAETQEVRERFGRDSILLGVLAREEKIHSRLNKLYLKAVASILEQAPTAKFLWTGRSESRGIREFFAERGLTERTPYVGWVNTASYAPALDIFLETFPFGCGMTAAQALAAGVPVVDFQDWSSVYGHHLEPLLSGRAGSDEDRAKVRALFTAPDGTDCFTMAPDFETYVATAVRLINDLDYRREVGAAGQRFYRAYLGNSVFSAERFSNIFRDLAQQKLRQCA